MTSLLPAPRTTGTRPERTAPQGRPLVLLAPLAGMLAAAATLVVCLAAGVVGWFLTDAGAHGAPRDGLRVGALGWLMAHGSGVHVGGVLLTAVPLGLTLLCAVSVWRVGLRLGDLVSGHGPDADAIADGVRDWTVLLATTCFTLGYALVLVVTHELAATAATAPSLGAALVRAVVMCGVLGGIGIAIGSGRAAIWTAFLPASLRLAAYAAWRLLVWYVVAATLTFLVALGVHWSAVLNVFSQLHTSTGAATLMAALCLLAVPNASIATGSYLLGPGFAVGAHTVVSPTAVVLGPLPLFPMLAALPHAGPTPGWTMGLLALPPLVAAVAVYRVLRPHGGRRWDEAAVRGAAAGLLAALGFTVLAWLAEGSVGPGRMQHVGPFVFSTLLHAIATFGVGGLLGGLAATFVSRRRA